MRLDCCALKAHTLLNDGQESEVTRIVARRPVGRDGNCSGNETNAYGIFCVTDSSARDGSFSGHQQDRLRAHKCDR